MNAAESDVARKLVRASRAWPRRAARSALTLGVAAAVTGSLFLAPAQAAVPAAPDQVVVAATMMARAKAVVASLEGRDGPTDPRYLADDVFVDGSPECLRCTIGPVALFAAYGVKSGDSTAIDKAVRVGDKVIADHQREDGAFAPGAPGEGGPAIQTVLGANVIAETYLILGNRLDADHRARWSASLAKSADFLIKNGNLTWYTNGNINLATSMNMNLTYRITGEARFKKAAADALAFTLNPPQDRWKGFGLQITQQPVNVNGSDGAGYLSESGSGGVGYDPAYTLFQANIATTWYALTGDVDALRLTNLLFNQMQPRVRASDWTIDVGGGTRRSEAGVRYRFTTSALPVLARRGIRPSLVPKVASQLGATVDEYTRATGYVSPGMSYNFAVELTPALLVLG